MTDIQSLFGALGDPTRRSLFERLSTGGPASASQLAHELPITRQAIAKHISTLESAGLVTRQGAGREVRFVANPERLDDLGSWSARVNRQWQERIQRLTEM
jgi:DNA-binding transcriptional ArsR family regulator